MDDGSRSQDRARGYRRRAPGRLALRAPAAAVCAGLGLALACAPPVAPASSDAKSRARGGAVALKGERAPGRPAQARFVLPAGWTQRIGLGVISEGPPRCGVARQTVAANLPLTRGFDDLPPTRLLSRMRADSILISLAQVVERCNANFRTDLPRRGVAALRLPLDLRAARHSQYPGERRGGASLYRLGGNVGRRYDVDVWVFFGRSTPTRAQRRAARAVLAAVRWPAQVR